MTPDAGALDRGLRATLWRTLRAHGFRERTERTAWREADGDVDVVTVQVVGQDAEAVGCTPRSFSVLVASSPRFLPRPEWTPTRKGRPRPRYWHCDPLVRSLEKTLPQPWFRPFGAPLDRRSSPSFRAHREALKAVVDLSVHDRPDVWYVREDGSNLDEVLANATSVVERVGLALLQEWHDPGRVLALLSPTAPHALEIRRAVEAWRAAP